MTFKPFSKCCAHYICGVVNTHYLTWFERSDSQTSGAFSQSGTPTTHLTPVVSIEKLTSASIRNIASATAVSEQPSSSFSVRSKLETKPKVMNSAESVACVTPQMKNSLDHACRQCPLRFGSAAALSSHLSEHQRFATANAAAETMASGAAANPDDSNYWEDAEWEDEESFEVEDADESKDYRPSHWRGKASSASRSKAGSGAFDGTAEGATTSAMTSAGSSAMREKKRAVSDFTVYNSDETV